MNVFAAKSYVASLRGKRQREFGEICIKGRLQTPSYKLLAEHYFRPIARGQEIADEIDRLLATD